MKTNAKLLLLTSTVVLLTAAATTWKFVEFYTGKSQNKEQLLLSQQVETLSEALAILNETTLEKLVSLAGQEHLIRKSQAFPEGTQSLNRSINKGPFVFLSVLKPGAQVSQWVAFNSSSKWNWSNELLQNASAAAARRVKGKSSFWFRVTGPHSQAYLGLATKFKFQGEERTAIGVLPLEHLSRIGTLFKGRVDNFMVVNDKGRALVYPEQQYLGATVTDDPMVKEILADKKNSGVGDFHNLDDERAAGAYHSVEATNLYAVLSRPYQATVVPYSEFILEVGLMTLVVMFLVGAIFAMFWNVIGLKLEYVKQSLTNMGNGMPVSHPPVQDSEFIYFHSLMTQVEKKVSERTEDQLVQQSTMTKFNVFKSCVENVFVALRDPLTAILGHSQLIQNELKSNEIENALEKAGKIEAESRSLRDWTEKLQQFSEIRKEGVEERSLNMWIEEIKSIPENADFSFSPLIDIAPAVEVEPPPSLAAEPASTEEPVQKETETDEINAMEAYKTASVEELAGQSPLPAKKAAFLPKIPGELEFVSDGLKQAIAEELATAEEPPARSADSPEEANEVLDLSDEFHFDKTSSLASAESQMAGSVTDEVQVAESNRFNFDELDDFKASRQESEDGTEIRIRKPRVRL